MKKLLQEFKEFALRGNVMDLAVGVIIGAAFQAIINSLVNDVISPLIGLFANTDLTYLSVMVGDVEIRYGAFLTAVINFIIMAVIIFLMVKGMNALAGLGKKKEPEKPAVKMCPYCRSKVAAEATRCPYCTSMLEVKKEDKKGRTLKVIKGTDGQQIIKENKNFYTQRELVDVPVIGKITAGQPILAVENVTDTFPIPIDFVGNSESFMLTVRGESMIEAGILDGDYILVKKQDNASNGEIVVALIEDEATVKTFYKENGHIRLQPENHTMDPIIVPDCKILGKVAGVFRKM